MSELQEMLCVQARLHRKQGANALGDLFENAGKEIESLSEQLAKANERIAELECQLQPDMFWNSDGDMSFDSLDDLFDYYGDCHEGGELLMDCRIGVSLPDKSYKGVYDADNNEWIITEQLRKEQSND